LTFADDEILNNSWSSNQQVTCSASYRWNY